MSDRYEVSAADMDGREKKMEYREADEKEEAGAALREGGC